MSLTSTLSYVFALLLITGGVIGGQVLLSFIAVGLLTQSVTGIVVELSPLFAVQKSQVSFVFGLAFGGAIIVLEYFVSSTNNAVYTVSNSLA
jgi:hypothetical protein